MTSLRSILAPAIRGHLRLIRSFCFFQKIDGLLKSQKVTDEDRLRLIMLYALRYERNSGSHVTEYVEKLYNQGTDEGLRALGECEGCVAERRKWL